MPRKRKSARELTSKQLARRVFPKEVKKELDRVAHEKDEKPKKPKRKRSP